MSLIGPDWPVPAGVRLGWTDRSGGVSAEPFASFNLAHHVGDDATSVDRNRERLLTEMAGADRIRWLSQIHSTHAVDAANSVDGVEADAAWSQTPGLAACVMTADCLPVFFWQDDGRRVAVAHAGWRGLAGGILSATLAAFERPDRVRCGVGPAIGPDAFEVGADVVDAFADWPGATGRFRRRETAGKWLADLPGLARDWLRHAGVPEVHFSGDCTVERPERYYSYRRDGRTGRMANLIWIERD